MLKKSGEKVTIEKLAQMVARGFEQTATKIELQNLRKEMNTRFDEVGERFDHIEKLILEEHRRRIERLEIEVKELKNALAM